MNINQMVSTDIWVTEYKPLIYVQKENRTNKNSTPPPPPPPPQYPPVWPYYPALQPAPIPIESSSNMQKKKGKIERLALKVDKHLP